MPFDDPLATQSHVRAAGLTRQTTVDHSTAPSGATDASATSIAGYSLIREIGRGGMGVVYHARHALLNRDAAIKMVLGTGPVDRREIIRFLAEAEAVAAIDHAHVVRVYDYGEIDGRPFMALEYLPGGTLAAEWKSGPRVPKEAALILSQISRGVAAAHSLGIVHRDLKPHNVLLAESGKPKVTDFGLAKKAGGVELTRTGAVMGTPAYMAPEQADGRTKYVGPAADVWALGVMLFECVTGHRPFRAGSTSELLAEILSAEPAFPTDRANRWPRDLEVICRKCLAKNAADRYPTAAELADDLERFTRGEPIGVRPPGTVERWYKWVRRNPTAASAGALAIVAVVAVIVGAVFYGQWRLTDEARALAERERTSAETARQTVADQKAVVEGSLGRERAAKREAEKLGENLADAEATEIVNTAYRDWDAGNVDRARLRLDGIREDLRGWEWNYVRRLCGDPSAQIKDQRLLYARDQVRLRFSPDGTRILYSRPLHAQQRATQWHLVADVPSRSVRATFNPAGDGYEGLVHAFNPAGGRLISRRSELTTTVPPLPQSVLLLTDAVSGKPVCRVEGVPDIPLAEGIPAIHFSSDLARLAVVGKDGTIRVWDGTSGRELHRIDGNFPPNRKAAAAHPVSYCARATIAPDGTAVAVAHLSADEPIIRIWDLAKGTIRDTIPVELPPEARNATGYLKDELRFSPDGGRLILSLQNRFVRSYNLADRKVLAKVSLNRSRDLALGASFYKPSHVLSPGCDRVAFSAMGCTVRIESLLNSEPGIGIAVPGGELRDLQFTFDNQLLTLGRDDNLRWWNATTGVPGRTVHGVGFGAVGRGFRPDGGLAVADISGDLLRIWERDRLSSPTDPRSIPTQGVSITNPDGTCTASLEHGAFWLWNSDRATPSSFPERTSILAYPTVSFESGNRVRYSFWEERGSRPNLTCARVTVVRDAHSGKELSRSTRDEDGFPGATVRYLSRILSVPNLSPDSNYAYELVPRSSDPEERRVTLEVVNRTTGKTTLRLEASMVAEWSYLPRQHRVLTSSPDDRSLVTADGAKASVWELATGRLRFALSSPPIRR